MLILVAVCVNSESNPRRVYVAFVSEVAACDHWLFVDRSDKERQTIVIEIETLSSQLETANKARVSCFAC